MPEKPDKLDEPRDNELIKLCAGCGKPIRWNQQYCGGDCQQTLNTDLDREASQQPRRRPPGVP